MPVIVLEKTFDPPLTDEERARRWALVTPCLVARGARWIRTYLSADRRRMVCEFEAPDADAVREALRSADVRFERAWVGERIDAPEPQEP